MQREFLPTVYILASQRNGTLYIGVTSNLLQRLHQHRAGLIEGFTKDYGVHRLVWFENGGSMEDAIRREKQIKKWNRQWKLELIEKSNPSWRDLALDLGFDPLD
jgi:putative endonuclease